MNDISDREVAVFNEALLLSGDERLSYLGEVCAGDSELRQRVEALLQVEEDAGTFFDDLERETRPESIVPGEKSGDCIGRFRLLERLGEGGCGVVYLAEQEQPVQLRVALKVIKLGMDTKHVVARFEMERQALALMDHPNIAKVFDAGATETGRPFFVMELVRGTRITDYCDQQRLGTEERLNLFLQVCRAIHHAHQKGIIHRDIKPSNILVTVHDAVPAPKVIDFGIAKATQGRFSNETVYTGLEQFIGTPAYMSPEQAEISATDVDTRSDIYSLGVLLYELLTSKTPFDSKELLATGVDAMRRTIQEKEPMRPSTRLNTLLGAELAEIARRHRMEAQKLIHSVRGDLDWIVMKALDKERSRRYETVNALGQDIERHLRSEPVAARPPSQWDRCRKMVHRNKLAVAAAIAVILALVLGLGLSTWSFLREKEARRQVLIAKEVQEHLRNQAEIEARKSRRTAEYLQEVLHRLSPAVASERDQAMLREILDSLKPTDDTPEGTDLLQMRALLRGQQGYIAEAGEDLARLIQVVPENTQNWHLRAAILAYTGQIDAYREHCRQSVERFKDTKERLTAERTAKDCLLLPSSGVDLNIVDKMVETALAGGYDDPDVGWFQLAKGMTEYRQGKYASALEWLEKVVPGRISTLDVQVLLMQAMGRYQLHQPAEAWETLDRAKATAIERNLRVSGGWIDWTIAQVLLREARSLIEGAGAGDVPVKRID